MCKNMFFEFTLLSISLYILFLFELYIGAQSLWFEFGVKFVSQRGNVKYYQLGIITSK